MDSVFWLFASPPRDSWWYYTECYWNIYSLVVPAKKQVTDGSKQAEGYKEEDENSVAHVSRL
jgi:hypothetical protein